MICCVLGQITSAFESQPAFDADALIDKPFMGQFFEPGTTITHGKPNM